MKRLSYLQPLSTLKPWDEYLKQHNKSTNEGKNFINGYQVWNQVRLTENNLFVLDSLDKDFLNQWGTMHDLMLKWGLWRDQIVYSYAMIKFQDKVQYLDSSRMACFE